MASGGFPTGGLGEQPVAGVAVVARYFAGEEDAGDRLACNAQLGCCVELIDQVRLLAASARGCLEGDAVGGDAVAGFVVHEGSGDGFWVPGSGAHINL